MKSIRFIKFKVFRAKLAKRENLEMKASKVDMDTMALTGVKEHVVISV